MFTMACRKRNKALAWTRSVQTSGTAFATSFAIVAAS